MDVDIGLFLATVATATSAFVAIVGGLLVSRVVAMATESSGLDHHLRDLAAALSQERGHSTRIEERLLWGKPGPFLKVATRISPPRTRCLTWTPGFGTPT